MLPLGIIHNQQAIKQAAKTAHLTYVGIFGSQSRGEAGSNSDFDLLFDYHPDQTPSLFTLGAFRERVSSLLQSEVDLVSRKALDPRLRPYIESDLQTVYEQK